MCSLSCKNQEVQTTFTQIKDSVATEIEDKNIDSINLAKTWLVTTIETYFAEFEKINGDYSNICTPEYKKFKEDATNVDMDGGMSEQEFEKTWGKETLKYAGLREGFLIGGNDFGTIKVNKSEFMERTEKNGFLFEIVLEDTEYQSLFKREVLVIPSGNSFLIDNVFEIENIFKGN